MLNKLLSLHYKVLIQATLSEVIESACRRPRYEYIVNEFSLWVPMAVNGRNLRDFHVYGPSRKGEDRREMYASLPVRDEGTDGEKGVDIDSALKRCVCSEFTSSWRLIIKMASIHLFQSVWQDGVFVDGERLLKLCFEYYITCVV